MSLASALNPLTGAARAWLIPAVMLLWLWLMACTLGTLWGVFKLGERHGRIDEQRLGLAAELVQAEDRAADTATFTRSANDALAAAAQVAQRAQAGQRRVQEDFNAYVKANPTVDCHLPVGFGRVWSAANAQAHPATDLAPAADAAGGLPAAAAAERPGAEHAAGQPLGSDPALSPLRRQPAGLGSVDSRAGGRE